MASFLDENVTVDGEIESILSRVENLYLSILPD